MKIPWLSVGHIEDAARSLRVRSLGDEFGQTALVDLDGILYDYLCEKEGLSFSDEHDLGTVDGETILGRFMPMSGKIEIAASLKKGVDLGRYRFTVAHEIGHWVLHRSLYLAEAETLDLFQFSDHSLPLTSLNENVFPDRSAAAQRPEEWQANRFAIALLIDAGQLRHEFGQRFGLKPVALEYPDQSLRGLSRALAKRATATCTPLCTVFGLSTEAMAIALEERGYAVTAAPIL